MQGIADAKAKLKAAADFIDAQPTHIKIIGVIVAAWAIRPWRWVLPMGRKVGILVGGRGTIPKGGKFGAPRSGGSRDHKGLDVFSKEGTPVYAAEAGRVEVSGVISGYGEVVVLRHSGGHRTLYSHLDRRVVKKGQEVAAGQPLGTVGRTANGKCGRYFCKERPHLHFEVITGEGRISRALRRTDPEPWLARQGISPSTVA